MNTTFEMIGEHNLNHGMANPKTMQPGTEGTGQPVAITEIETFDSFFRREFVGLVSLAEAVSGDPAHAEDLAAEAMSRAHAKWDTVSQHDKPGAWVRRVTINLAHSRRRRRGTESRALRANRHETTVAPPEPHHPVWAAVAKLPKKQRAAVALRYIEDLPVADIADILECTVSTATSHLHEGRKKLAQLLEKGGQS